MVFGGASVAVVGVTAIVDALGALGVDVAAILARAAVDEIWDAAEAVTGDAHVGLTVATRVTPRALGAYYYLLQSAPTWRACVDLARRFFALIDSGSRIEVFEDPVLARVRFLHGPDPVWNRHDVECLFAVIEVVTTEMAPGHAQLGVRFAHGARTPLARYQASFLTMPTFDAAHHEIVMPIAAFDRPRPHADAGLTQVLESHAGQLLAAVPTGLPLDDVQRAIAVLLPRHQVSLTATARLLGTSERTLRRRLAEAGETFRAIVDRHRRTIAEHQVGAGDRALKEIAEDLGFADPPSFLRAFRRWFGVPPAEFRAAQKAQPPRQSR